MIVNQYKPSLRQRLKQILIGKKGLEVREELYYKKMLQDFLSNFDYENPPKPKRIEIETINKCNGECSFCPANRHNDKRPLMKMEDEVFRKIIIELAEWGYAGRIGLHSNNEPLLDPRIMDFAAFAKINLPDAKVYMYTNGTLLTVEKLKKLMQHLDYIVIDNYNDALELNEEIKPIQEILKKDMDLERRVQIHIRKRQEVLGTRGGKSPNNNGKDYVRPYSCFLPFIQMVFRPDGKLSFCCSDVFGTMTMGDVKKQSVMEIWNGDYYREMRKIIAEAPKEIAICRHCNMKNNAG